MPSFVEPPWWALLARIERYWELRRLRRAFRKAMSGNPQMRVLDPPSTQEDQS